MIFLYQFHPVWSVQGEHPLQPPILFLSMPLVEQATIAYERECEALEGLKQALQATRKDCEM